LPTRQDKECEDEEEDPKEDMTYHLLPLTEHEEEDDDDDEDDEHWSHLHLTYFRKSQ